MKCDYSKFINERYNNLVLVELKEKDRHNHPFGLFICDCGVEKEFSIQEVIHGKRKSCGCLRVQSQFIRTVNYESLLGKQINFLTVLAFGKPNKENRETFLCECICGMKKEIPCRSIYGNRIKSCGCIKRKHLVVMSTIPELEKKKLSQYYTSYKSAAKSRGYSFDLSIEYFCLLIKELCWYCGSFPTFRSIGSRQREIYLVNGIDRKDNALGYTVENVVPCCTRCNSAKMCMNYEDFIEWIHQTHKFLSEKKIRN